MSGAEHFLSFIDDRTRYVWGYFLKCKHQVINKFLEWKTLVKKSYRRKLKAFRTDNGEKFIVKEFGTYLTEERIWHELTIPQTPEQNGAAERMNGTLVETTRTMLFNANLLHRF